MPAETISGRSGEQPRSISEVTRRAIRDEIVVGQVAWSGRLSESEFLARFYPVGTLPSHDGRFANMSADIWQHRENNYDWDDYWVFSDDRLNLMDGADDAFLRFLCEMVHPVVRPDSTEARRLVDTFNQHLLVDGWELVEARLISGKPTFREKRRASGAVALPDPAHATDVLSDDYVRELADKCEARLASGDLDGAVTVARTLLEAVLSELEVRLTGAKEEHKGNLPKQFKQVTKLLRMDEQRSDLDARFKDVIRGLVMVANGLAPLRNSMSDGHARERKPAPHHAQVVVNAAKTVSAFLVESYNYQIGTGQLQDMTVPASKTSA
ncbi:MAG: abortive infection family protein [Dehalococcoidia bacterium]|nr:abortive infection family protein [Dehalococcoidia bacterium]